MRKLVLSAVVGLLLTTSVSAQDKKLIEMMEFASAASACFALHPQTVSEEAANKMLSMARAEGNHQLSYNNVMEQVRANIPLSVLAIVSDPNALDLCTKISDYMYLIYEVDNE